MYLVTGPKDPMQASMRFLGRFLNYHQSSNVNNNSQNTYDIKEEQGILTNHGWHAYLSDNERHDALIKAIMFHGIDRILGTLQHLCHPNRWGSPNSHSHQYLPIVENDIDWIRNYNPISEKTRIFLAEQLSDIRKNNKEIPYASKKIGRAHV